MQLERSEDRFEGKKLVGAQTKGEGGGGDSRGCGGLPSPEIADDSDCGERIPVSNRGGLAASQRLGFKAK